MAPSLKFTGSLPVPFRDSHLAAWARPAQWDGPCHLSISALGLRALLAGRREMRDRLLCKRKMKGWKKLET